MIWFSALLFTGFWLDYILGEPNRFHPLVGFGHCANKIEQWLNKGNQQLKFIAGIMAWSTLVLPVPTAYIYLIQQNTLPPLIVYLMDVVIIYWALGHKSLREHGLQIYQALKCNKIEQARQYTSYIVSRDTAQLTEQDISRATTESMLENGHDAVIATLVWYMIGGAPLVIIHRLANTLDAMWGYRNKRFNYFGRFSARADDILGFISAKITCLLFAMLGLRTGKFFIILKNSYDQGKKYKSHNGGWVMAAGASLLKVKLGGISTYQKKVTDSPTLGYGEKATTKHISASLMVINQASILLILTILLFDIVRYF